MLKNKIIMLKNKIILPALAILMMASPALAQMDEIIVTGTRKASSNNNGLVSSSSEPGLFLEKKGDFLLLQVSIENDSRDLSTRLKEINATVDLLITAAEDDPEIKLSIIDNSFVRPLSRETFRKGIRRGSRPDTSIAYLKVKTEIPEKVEDSFRLATKLSEFVDGIEEVGRTKISSNNDIAVSVVNPYQYRDDVAMMVVEEINTITDTLGPEYRAVIRGLDKELKWVRSGDLNLAFYLPYTYDIIPNTLHSYQNN